MIVTQPNVLLKFSGIKKSICNLLFYFWQKHHEDKVVNFCYSYCQNKLHGKVGESVTVLIEKEMHSLLTPG